MGLFQTSWWFPMILFTKHTYYRAEVSYYLSICLHIICDLCYLMSLHSLTSYCSLSNFCLLLNCAHMIVSLFTAYVKVFTGKSSFEFCSHTKEFLQKMHHRISVEFFQVPLLSPTQKAISTFTNIIIQEKFTVSYFWCHCPSGVSILEWSYVWFLVFMFPTSSQ